MNDRQIVVFHEPFGRLVRFLPEFQAEFERLKQAGFYRDPVGNSSRYTLAGWLMHILANEINPRRAFERTTLRLNHRLYWWARNHCEPGQEPASEEAFLPTTETLLADLNDRGYIVPSAYAKTQKSWSVLY
ncbi:hypothetical protein HOT99_gp215 [Caulobacter phage CcrBL10]|uniref:Uncharacterized protein n=1 Tax=Caulobacter phage CcrBL10 TaxID=2283269 RepID=A0A385EC13_9CAUD|nr:hypothetical protein HOT99_gp215 [Caulobacter phage CcrBL10]AXQ68402.1 hypothetical protein CcrBL10_gp198c [Caulobacter phage CcrBL10]